jgi:DDE superfamily endonuclease
VSSLVSLGQRTVTGLIGTSGRQFADWSADYRLFSRESRFRPEPLFRVVLSEILGGLSRDEPLVVALDDSYLPKAGRHVSGAGWARDSHAPPFLSNFIWSQRVLQLSAASFAHIPGPARMIPVDFTLAPAPRRPSRRAGEDEQEAYLKARRHANINLVGAERIGQMRRGVDELGGADRSLVVVGDGRFTNGTVLRALPEKTTLIGRVRKDTKLFFLPLAPPRGRGRRPAYGSSAPTPEELLRDESVPFTAVTVHAAGRLQCCLVKTLAPLRWRTAGPARDLRLVVIAPLGYRLREGGRLLYRDPAYLICTDPGLSLKEIAQAYIWRWDIEVNFRDEKALLGVGEAQVRVAPSVERVPQLLVASYALLLCAARRVFGQAATPELLPPPKWRRHGAPSRATTKSLISHLRAELWGEALGVNDFSGFTLGKRSELSPQKSGPDLPSAVLYAA